jgi:hypothetical protein
LINNTKFDKKIQKLYIYLKIFVDFRRFLEFFVEFRQNPEIWTKNMDQMGKYGSNMEIWT